MRTANLFTRANRKLLKVVDRDFPRFRLIENPQYFAEASVPKFQPASLAASEEIAFIFSSADRTYSVWSSIFISRLQDSAFHLVSARLAL